MFKFRCERCGYIYDDKKIYKKYQDKEYCLNCYTLLYGKEKKEKTGLRYTKEPKVSVEARINKKDYDKISDVNISEFIRKSVEYIVTHPQIKYKIIGD